MLYLIFLIVAIILALLAAFEPWSRPFWPPHFGWLAMFFFFLALLLSGVTGAGFQLHH